MTHSIDQAIFDVAKVLEVPVLILALLALAAVIVELGAFGSSCGFGVVGTFRP